MISVVFLSNYLKRISAIPDNLNLDIGFQNAGPIACPSDSFRARLDLRFPCGKVLRVSGFEYTMTMQQLYLCTQTASVLSLGKHASKTEGCHVISVFGFAE